MMNVLANPDEYTSTTLSAGMPFVVVIGVMLMNSLVSAFMYCDVITFIKAFIS